jgi:hypothetical protein
MSGVNGNLYNKIKGGFLHTAIRKVSRHGNKRGKTERHNNNTGGREGRKKGGRGTRKHQTLLEGWGGLGGGERGGTLGPPQAH